MSATPPFADGFQHYAPQMDKRPRWYRRHRFDSSWRVDETYVKIKGQWKYLYRTIDKSGRTIDFVSFTQEVCSAITTDTNAAYGEDLDSMKKHVNVKLELSTNNRLETVHGKLREIDSSGAWFKSMKAAYATNRGLLHSLCPIAISQPAY